MSTDLVVNTTSVKEFSKRAKVHSSDLRAKAATLPAGAPGGQIAASAAGLDSLSDSVSSSIARIMTSSSTAVGSAFVAASSTNLKTSKKAPAKALEVKPSFVAADFKVTARASTRPPSTVLAAGLEWKFLVGRDGKAFWAAVPRMPIIAPPIGALWILRVRNGVPYWGFKYRDGAEPEFGSYKLLELERVIESLSEHEKQAVRKLLADDEYSAEHVLVLRALLEYYLKDGHYPYPLSGRDEGRVADPYFLERTLDSVLGTNWRGRGRVLPLSTPARVPQDSMTPTMPNLPRLMVKGMKSGGVAYPPINTWVRYEGKDYFVSSLVTVPGNGFWPADLPLINGHTFGDQVETFAYVPDEFFAWSLEDRASYLTRYFSSTKELQAIKKQLMMAKKEDWELWYHQTFAATHSAQQLFTHMIAHPEVTEFAAFRKRFDNLKPGEDAGELLADFHRTFAARLPIALRGGTTQRNQGHRVLSFAQTVTVGGTLADPIDGNYPIDLSWLPAPGSNYQNFMASVGTIGGDVFEAISAKLLYISFAAWELSGSDPVDWDEISARVDRMRPMLNKIGNVGATMVASMIVPDFVGMMKDGNYAELALNIAATAFMVYGAASKGALYLSKLEAAVKATKDLALIEKFRAMKAASGAALSRKIDQISRIRALMAKSERGEVSFEFLFRGATSKIDDDVLALTVDLFDQDIPALITKFNLNRREGERLKALIAEAIAAGEINDHAALRRIFSESLMVRVFKDPAIRDAEKIAERVARVGRQPGEVFGPRFTQMQVIRANGERIIDFTPTYADEFFYGLQRGDQGGHLATVNGGPNLQRIRANDKATHTVLSDRVTPDVFKRALADALNTNATTAPIGKLQRGDAVRVTLQLPNAAGELVGVEVAISFVPAINPITNLPFSATTTTISHIDFVGGMEQIRRAGGVVYHRGVPQW